MLSLKWTSRLVAGWVFVLFVVVKSPEAGHIPLIGKTWDSGCMPIQHNYFFREQPQGIDQEQFRRALEVGTGLWEKATGGNLDICWIGESDNANRASDSGFTKHVIQDINSPGTLGFTTPPPGCSGSTVIYYSPNASVLGEWSRSLAEFVVTHETGHSIGFNHAGRFSDSIMRPQGGPGSQPRLTDEDIQDVRELYGFGSGDGDNGPACDGSENDEPQPNPDDDALDKGAGGAEDVVETPDNALETTSGHCFIGALQ